VLEVTDNSGILAVVVPAAYETFVDNDWQLAQLPKGHTSRLGYNSDDCNGVPDAASGFSGKG
jgi:hypothetical protein